MPSKMCRGSSGIKKMVPILMGTLYQFGMYMSMYVQCQLSSIPLIVFVQRFPKAKWFKKKGWLHYFAVQAMIPTVARVKGVNVFQPLQDPPDDDSEKQEDGEKWEGEPEENVGDENIDNKNMGNENVGNENIDWPASDDESMLDPALCTNSKPVSTAISPLIDACITAPLAPLGLHKRKYSAIIASGSGSPSATTTTSP
jgi:hypothetical protein